MRTSTALLALCSAITSVALGQQPPPGSGERHRPRIGLVLGGGGARGAAHIGVLRVLEELRIPIDCIAGTSMGALVGAAYASGMSSSELRDLMTSINWSATIGGEGLRALQSVREKSAQFEYSNSLEFGIRRGRIGAPGGLLPTQGVDSLLRTIVSGARYRDSFDDLPIPFRAIGTDLGSGEMLVLSGGDLSVAMRASMAVPGVFAPVRLGSHVVVDGGLVRNLPVDVARETCADVVIASSIVNPEKDLDQLRSAFAILGQLVSALIKNNERLQLEALRPGDVAVRISVPGIGSGDFDKTSAVIPLGEEAARAVSAQLAPYGVSPDEYARWRAGLVRKSSFDSMDTQVTEVRITGLQRVNEELVRQQIQARPGEPYSEEQIVADAQRIFALGDFEKVDYNITAAASRGGRIVEFVPAEKDWGPDYLRFDLGLLYSSGGEASFLLRADHARRWINSLGGEWNNTLQIGRVALLSTGLFQPLNAVRRFFLEPRLEWKRQQQDVYFGEQRVARYFDTSMSAQIELGATFGTWGELRVGLKRARTDYTLNTGSPVLREFHDVSTGALTSRFTIDTRDSAQLPERGTYLHLDTFSAEGVLGSDASYQRIEFFGQQVFNIHDRLLYLEIAGGTDFDRHAPVYDLFTLGGVGQLAGLQYEELRGHEYAFGRIGHLWKVTDLQSLLGRALYAGVTVEAGNMFGRIDGSNAQGAIFGSSLFFGGRTPLGSLWIVFGIAEGGRKAAYVQLGRPFEIR